MSFIFMNRRPVKDNCGGISLNVVLKTEKEPIKPMEGNGIYSILLYLAHFTCYNQNVHVFTLEQRPWWMVQSRVPNFICPTNWIDAFLSSGSKAWQGGHHWTRSTQYINIGFLETSCYITSCACERRVSNRSKEVNQPGFFSIGGKVVRPQSCHMSVNTIPCKTHNVVQHIFTCKHKRYIMDKEKKIDGIFKMKLEMKCFKRIW